MIDVKLSQKQIPPEFLAHMAPEEAEGAGEVSERDDTWSIIMSTKDGKPLGYVVFGLDTGENVAVYYARSFVPVLGQAIMRQFLGVAQVMGETAQDAR